MFVLRKNAGSISMPRLGLVPEIMPRPNFFSLEVFYRYPDAKQMVFYCITDAQRFIRNHPTICGADTVICRPKFTTNGVTFEPIPVSEIPPKPTGVVVDNPCAIYGIRNHDEDDDIPF